MCQSILKIDREDIDPDDTPDYFDKYAPPTKLLHFIRHCEADSYFQMALAFKVQLLPLTRQLCNLAGNSWSKTLNGGRAERNEYILLHEFHRQKYVCPDKISRWERTQIARTAAADPEDDDGAVLAGDETEAKGTAAGMGKKGTAKKDKYKGGLVFDPKRGLWDKYVLVMDFNSLYPSIIQEFNIDFTTIERHSGGGEADEAGDDVDKIPEIPGSDVKQGVLPRLIATLVNRRKQVKSLMKDRSASQAKQLQVRPRWGWD
jgi:DNA polymerase alpha subunit A